MYLTLVKCQVLSGISGLERPEWISILYNPDAVARREARLGLREKVLTPNHAGELLSRYAVKSLGGTGSHEPQRVS